MQKHFTEDQWEKVRVDGKRKLKASATPTVFSHSVSTPKRRKLVLCQQHPIAENKCSSSEDTGAELQQQFGAELQQQNEEDGPINSVEISDTYETSECEISNKLHKLEEFIKLQQIQISALKKKVSFLTLRNSRLRKKLQNRYTSVPSKFKKLFNENQLDCLHQKKVKWTADSVKKALQVKFACGSKGFNFLVSSGWPFPSQRTLRRRLQDLKFSSGILDQVFVLLKEKVETMSVKERDCVLLLDEMAITPSMEFDVGTGEFTGHVTLPSHEGVATHACVFLLGGITSRWKQVVAYYFTGSSISGNVLCDIILEIIRCSEQIGLRVQCVTSDMGAANQSMWRQFGIVSGKNSILQNYILNPVDPARKIYFIADVPHLLKNIRQCLQSNTVINIPEQIRDKYKLPSTVVDCNHIKELHDFDHTNDLKLVPKLTKDVIEPNKFNKMKVAGARTFLSHETSCGLKFISSEIDKVEYRTTAWFVELVNKWFTIMTARHPVTALSTFTPERYEEAINFLREVMMVFECIEIGKYGHWKPVQSGVRLSTQSVLDLQDLFLHQNSYKFLLTSRLSQDCLENLFSCVRSIQKVPTALQFKNNLKIICVAQFFTDVGKGSYDQSDSVYLSSFLDKNPVKCANSSVSQSVFKIPKGWIEKEISSDEELCNIERNALYHIAGYIIGRTLKFDKVCEKCLNQVASHERQNKDYCQYVNLKQFKQDKDSLLYASEKCFCFFLKMEVIFRSITHTLQTVTNLNCVQFLLHKFYDNDNIKRVKFLDCHNIKLKLMKRFIRFRLKVYCLKMRKNVSVTYGHVMASKTSAMHALAQKVR